MNCGYPDIVPGDEPERADFFASFGHWATRMYQLWKAVGVYGHPQRMSCPWGGGGEGGAGEWHIQDGLLRLVLEQGHSALEASDDGADVIEAMVLIRDTLNSDHDVWPETHGMTQDEWAEMYAEGDAKRAAQAVVAEAGA